MVPGGYAWWYLDALSDDGQHGLAIIVFLGSVFSPYYAWSGRRDPLDHCAVNAALYGPRDHLWAMTERGRRSLVRERRSLAIGASAISWDGSAFRIALDEISVPLPRRIRGSVRVDPLGVNPEPFALDSRGRHLWRPIAPCARVSVDFQAPDLRWSGKGYLDMNLGREPLEAGFHDWAWSRAVLDDGAAILYDAKRRDDAPLSLALRFDKSGRYERADAPRRAKLPLTRWRLPRATRSQDGEAAIVRELEDAPFYSRSLVSNRLFGAPALCMHESLSLDRFRNPIVRLMLPFRMPRRAN